MIGPTTAGLWKMRSSGEKWTSCCRIVLEAFLKIVKVKGHATMEHVRKGIVSMEDKVGNDTADTLAVAGALANE